MWFRNLLTYRFTRPVDLDAETVESALASRRSRPCGSQEAATYGFIAPLGKGPDAPLVHAAHGFMLIAARREERLLPSSVVKDAVAEKVEEIELKQGRKVYKKERDQLREEVMQTLMPRAFVRRSATFAALAPAASLLFVNAATYARAEELLSCLREVLETLPVRPIDVKVAPTFTFTEWLRAPQSQQTFTVLDECELRDAHEDGGVVRCKRQDLGSDEILQHLNAGKLVTQLSLAWQDKLSFTLDEKLAIKRLRFEDILQEQAMNDAADDALSQADASFTLMMLTLAEFLPQLTNALGGENIPEVTDAGTAAGGQETVKKG
jgi:recombination associated protein RdgC